MAYTACLCYLSVDPIDSEIKAGYSQPIDVYRVILTSGFQTMIRVPSGLSDADRDKYIKAECVKQEASMKTIVII